jgi:hypothetical protein
VQSKFFQGIKMVVKKHILNNINRLNSLYNSSPTVEATYYSKLAIIELCGWIELSMDNIVEHFANKNLKTQPFKTIFKDLKKRNNGFDYKKNFRHMLSQTAGLHNIEKVETKLIITGQIAVLDATLESLKTLRNDAAHSYIDATKTYQSPSVTKSQLEQIYPILKDFSKEIKKIK